MTEKYFYATLCEDNLFTCQTKIKWIQPVTSDPVDLLPIFCPETTCKKTGFNEELWYPVLTRATEDEDARRVMERKKNKVWGADLRTAYYLHAASSL